MKYFALGSKANIKVADHLTLEDIRKQAIDMGIMTYEELYQVVEIERDEFVKPIDIRPIEPEVIAKRSEPIKLPPQDDLTKIHELAASIPSWQSIIDELRLNSVMEE